MKFVLCCDRGWIDKERGRESYTRERERLFRLGLLVRKGMGG